MLNIILLSLVAVMICGCDAGNTDSSDKLSDSYVTVDVSPYDYRKTFLVRGDVLSFGSVNLVSQATGRVTDILVDNGFEVNKGDALLILECDDRAETVKKLRTILSQREKEYEIESGMRKRGYSSESSIIGARSAMQAAVADLEIAKINYDKCFVRAPIDGRVDHILPSVGDLVNSGESITKILGNFIKISSYVSGDEFDMIDEEVKHEVLLDNEYHKCEVSDRVFNADNVTKMYEVQLKCDKKTESNTRFGYSTDIKMKSNAFPAYKVPATSVALVDDNLFAVKTLNNGKVNLLKAEVVSQDDDGYFWIRVAQNETLRVIVHSSR